jgi:hypothetical protein
MSKEQRVPRPAVLWAMVIFLAMAMYLAVQGTALVLAREDYTRCHSRRIALESEVIRLNDSAAFWMAYARDRAAAVERLNATLADIGRVMTQVKHV